MIALHICSVPLLVFIVVYVSGDAYDVLNTIDFDAMRRDPKILDTYFECLINVKGCTPDYEQVRQKLPEMFKTCCALCPKSHKEELLAMREYLLKTKPEFLVGLLNKYDPDGELTAYCIDKIQ